MLLSGCSLVLETGTGGVHPARDPGELIRNIEPEIIRYDNSLPRSSVWSASLPDNACPLSDTELVPEYSLEDSKAHVAARAFGTILADTIIEVLAESGLDIPGYALSDPICSAFESPTYRYFSAMAALRKLVASGPAPIAIGVAENWLAPALISMAAKHEIYLIDLRSPDDLKELPPLSLSRAKGDEDLGRHPDLSEIRQALARIRAELQDTPLPCVPDGTLVLSPSRPDPSGGRLATIRELGRALAARTSDPIQFWPMARQPDEVQQLKDDAAVLSRDGRDVSVFDLTAWMADHRPQGGGQLCRLLARPVLHRCRQEKIDVIDATVSEHRDFGKALIEQVLPGILVKCLQLDALLSKRRPRSITACRGRPPEKRALLLLASVHDVPSIDIQPTGLSPGPIHRRPIGDRVLVPDRRSRKLIVDRFASPEERVTPVGSVPFLNGLERASALGQEATRLRIGWPHDGRKVLLFCPSAGRDEFYDGLLSLAIKALSGQDRAFVVVKPHPKQSSASIQTYRSILGKAAPNLETRIEPGLDIYEAIIGCDLVLTGFSTVGLEASLCGRPVLAYTRGLPLAAPIDYVMGYLPLTFDCPDALEDALVDAMRDGPIMSEAQQRLARYRRENPEMFDMQVAERMAEIVMAMPASACPPVIADGLALDIAQLKRDEDVIASALAATPLGRRART